MTQKNAVAVAGRRCQVTKPSGSPPRTTIRAPPLSPSNLLAADGIPGIEVGGWYPAYFSNLTVTRP
jgi:hypothetical protein